MKAPEEITSGGDFESIARRIIGETLGRDTPKDIVNEEAMSLAYTLAAAAHVRIEELQATFIDH